MLIVIADDFTGAAEMGGIGYRYGLSTEIQLQPDLTSAAELIVIDADTRSMNEADAVRKTQVLADLLKNAGKEFTLFKKVDSVMRGYIAIECRIIQQELGYKRVLLLPANPSRGRKIMRGSYYLDGITLDQTIFSADPDFPIASALVEKVIRPKEAGFSWQHISSKEDLPDVSLITGDVETKDDIEHYVDQLWDDDLCVGAAECFEVFLQKRGYGPVDVMPQDENKSYTLIVNGSTVKRSGERAGFRVAGIPYSSMPDLKDDSNWQASVLEQLKEHSAVVVAIDDPLNRENNRPTIYLDRYVKLAHYISNAIGIEKIHFGLTGGATASAIIRSMGIKRLQVKQEVIPGVVTLEGDGGLFTVKPGSYAWPERFFDDLSKR